MKARLPFVLVLVMGLAASARAQMPTGPGPEHQALAALAGDWSGTVTLQLPGMEPMSSEIRRSSRMDLNGLWLISDYEGTMMGIPFKGHSIWGYDPEKGRHVEIWVDSFQATIRQLEGDHDAANGSWTKWVEGVNPMNGQAVRERHSVKLGADGRFVLEMATPGPDGGYLPYMQVQMTKQP